MLAAVGVCLARARRQGIWRGALRARVGTFQLEAMGTVNDTIDIRIAARQTADTFLSMINRNLAGDQP